MSRLNLHPANGETTQPEYGSNYPKSGLIETVEDHNEALDPAGLEISNVSEISRRSSRWAALSMGVQAAKVILLFGSQIWMAHLLSPAQFGLLALTAPVMNIFSIVNDLGLASAAIQRPKITQGELSALFWINILVGLVMASALIASAPLIAWGFGDRRLTLILICLSALLFLSNMTSQQVVVMTRRMDYVPLVLLDIVPVSISVSGGIIAAMEGCGYWSLVIGQGAHAVTATLMSWLMSGWRPSRPSRVSGILPLIRFGSHIVGYNVIGFFGTSLQNVLVGLADGELQVGLYDRGYRIVLMTYSQVATPICRVAESMLARLLHREQAYREAFLQLTQVMLVLCTPGLLAGALFSHAVVLTLFGTPWIGSIPIIHWLCVGTLLAPLNTAGRWLLISQNRTSQLFNYGLVSTGSIVLSMLAGLHWGANGVAYSYACFSIVTHGALLVGSTRRGLVTLRMICNAALPIYAGLAVTAMILYPLESHFDSILPFWRCVGLFEGVVASYGISSAVTCLFPEGRHMIRRLICRVRVMARRSDVVLGSS